MSSGIEALIAELAESMPGFSVASRDDGSTTLRGSYSLFAEFEGVLLAGDYQLEIVLPSNYPAAIPTVLETSGAIRADYEHMYENGALCLGVDGDIAASLAEDASLVRFVDTYVREALYSAKYYDRYGIYPFGDRAHGLEGILSYYAEAFDVGEEGAFGILACIASGKYRGHQGCPCGSGLKGRDCHGPDIVAAINSPVRRNAAISDFERIADEAEARHRINAERRAVRKSLARKRAARLGGAPAGV